MEENTMTTLLNQKLRAIQNSIQYCKTEYEKTDNPHIQQKIQKYKTELEKEEASILQEIGDQ